MDATPIATSSAPDDPLQMLRRLDAEVLSARIETLDAERAALMVLLRAARRRTPPEMEVRRHAN